MREPDEVMLGSIPSSVNLPLSELKDALDPHYNPGKFAKVSLETHIQCCSLTYTEIRLREAPAQTEHGLLLQVWETVGDCCRARGGERIS